MAKQRITVAKGDGIGPEIMEASIRVLEAAGADVEWDYIEVGEKVYLSGNTSGIGKEAWDSIKKNKVLFKAPITTPQGGGYKSLNVTIRKTLGLYSNVRPSLSYAPFIPTRYPGMDVVVIRENEEDLYAGIEHQQTPEVTQCLKIITRPGCEKISRYAFEYAKAFGRKRITCMIKDNIMKLTDGLFVKVFYEIAKEYPEIQADDWIIDIGMAKLVDAPQDFDMVLMPNLYGDVATDILGLMTGSVGIAPGANVGDDIAMYEAIHGSAPRHAGKGIANPSALLLSGVMMMVDIGQARIAEKVHNAWLKTIEDGVVTYDLARKLKAEGREYTEVNTEEFADAVIERLGQKPTVLAPKVYGDAVKIKKAVLTDVRSQQMDLIGVDIFTRGDFNDAKVIGDALVNAAQETGMRLKMISNRGLKVYPNGHPETFLTDHWRCRYYAKNQGDILKNEDITNMMNIISTLDGIEVIKTENLYKLEGELAYSLGQGE
ncbi:NADP-dependent isocitrate dehydrogenase [Sulfurimonas sp. SAG-AH-194-L11]|nr:NADP-dependent isocitrate dehydrogenase [Sulfurimonas sp. SAG-AH-194-L11]MDF1877053.1 NADP-dependent isocitrate dehydrogenase [Sulfurimonas sp. SAG-AH-194-L11]